MTITREQIEKILVGRVKKRMAFVEMDSTTTNGTNADLNDPIATALIQMGVTPANISAITDSDLASVTDVIQIADLAELRLLENIVGNLDVVDLAVGPRRESLNQMTENCEKAIARLTKKIQHQYGIGITNLQNGTLALNFIEQDE